MLYHWKMHWEFLSLLYLSLTVVTCIFHFLGQHTFQETSKSVQVVIIPINQMHEIEQSCLEFVQQL